MTDLACTETHSTSPDTASIRRRKLFTSYPMLIRRLARDKVSVSDLRDGLFFFSCSREDVFGATPENPGYQLKAYFSQDWERGWLCHGLLKAALELAEREGRILWPQLEGSYSVQQLNRLLKANGYEPLEEDPNPYHAFGQYAKRRRRHCQIID